MQSTHAGLLHPKRLPRAVWATLSFSLLLLLLLLLCPPSLLLLVILVRAQLSTTTYLVDFTSSKMILETILVPCVHWHPKLNHATNHTVLCNFDSHLCYLVFHSGCKALLYRLHKMPGHQILQPALSTCSLYSTSLSSSSRHSAVSLRKSKSLHGLLPLHSCPAIFS